MNNLSTVILKIQGDGDAVVRTKSINEKDGVGKRLQSNLDRLNTVGIALDVVFQQGKDVLGL